MPVWLRASSALLILGLAACSGRGNTRPLVGSATCTNPGAAQEQIAPAGVSVQGGITAGSLNSVSVASNGATLSAVVRLSRPVAKLAIPFLDTSEAHLSFVIDLYHSATGPVIYSLTASRTQGGPWSTDNVVQYDRGGHESPGEVEANGDEVTLSVPMTELSGLDSPAWFTAESTVTAKGSVITVSNEQSCPPGSRIRL